MAKSDLVLQSAVVAAEKNRMELEYKAGSVQLKAAEVTGFINTGISVMIFYGSLYGVGKKCFSV